MANKELDTGGGVVRIAVVDQHYVIHAGLTLIVSEFSGYAVTIAVLDAKELELHRGTDEPAHIAIVDMGAGVEAIQWFRLYWPATRVLAKSDDPCAAVMHAALSAGACGFIPNTFSRLALRDALEDVRLRGYYHDDGLIRTLGATPPPADLSTLKRVLQVVLDCVCTDDEPGWELVAVRLHRSKSTVESHCAALFKALGVKSKAGLVSLGRAHGYGQGRYWSGKNEKSGPEG